MGIELKMPALSPTMEEGTLAKWLVKEGDTVKSGDILAEIETDKATMEFEAIDEGVIGKILVPEGTEGVKVGTVIAVIGEGGEAHPQPLPQSGGEPDVLPSPLPLAGGVGGGPEKAPTNRPADPAIPAGTNMRQITLREALRDAMAEEMRRDDRVFVMGEEVAQYQGAY